LWGKLRQIQLNANPEAAPAAAHVSTPPSLMQAGCHNDFIHRNYEKRLRMPKETAEFNGFRLANQG
jgi:hypothetical protein